MFWGGRADNYPLSFNYGSLSSSAGGRSEVSVEFQDVITSSFQRFLVEIWLLDSSFSQWIHLLKDKRLREHTFLSESYLFETFLSEIHQRLVVTAAEIWGFLFYLMTVLYFVTWTSCSRLLSWKKYFKQDQTWKFNEYKVFGTTLWRWDVMCHSGEKSQP